MDYPTKQYSFQEYVEIVRRLRRECPWDKQQTHMSLRHSFLEEAYEVLDSINNNNLEELKYELGDILLHVTLDSIIAEEMQAFSIEDVISTSSEKMIRRHPHVFGNEEASNADDVKQQWEQRKLDEGRESILDGIPKELPALLKAQRVQEKASKVGFDWTEKSDVWKKVEEELSELKKAEESGNQQHIEEEFGDVLFALVNYARFLHLESEFALQKATEKFIVRFQKIEDTLKQQGKDIRLSNFEEMDSLWNLHKKDEQA
ncbi:MAG TPA: nucleoside triphosphate pyrophosphohydrolase [Bacteroidota bacterium]|nr:nucleoside triphosphate pyrophosphohydrolase [Bacteroidota bacterium]